MLMYQCIPLISKSVLSHHVSALHKRALKCAKGSVIVLLLSPLLPPVIIL